MPYPEDSEIGKHAGLVVWEIVIVVIFVLVLSVAIITILLQLRRKRARRHYEARTIEESASGPRVDALNDLSSPEPVAAPPRPMKIAPHPPARYYWNQR